MYVNINLDGSGVANCNTGIPFLDHMLDVSSRLLFVMLFEGWYNSKCKISDHFCYWTS